MTTMLERLKSDLNGDSLGNNGEINMADMIKSLHIIVETISFLSIHHYLSQQLSYNTKYFILPFPPLPLLPSPNNK